MPFTHALHRALPVCALALAVSAAPALAFEPAVIVTDTASGDSMTVTDIAIRGANLAVTIDARIDEQRVAILSSSTDRGLSWTNVPLFDVATRESQATVCAGRAVMIFTSADMPTATEVDIISLAVPLDGGQPRTRLWTTSGFARKPDIACVANDEVVSAWFQKDGSGHHVRVRTLRAAGATTSGQSFDLGAGTMSRGLAVAASSTRVYVAWFQGDSLKLRRFSIGGAPNHDLTTLGTSTVATLQYAAMPELDADGALVVLAYTAKADLKARRSTNQGVSFGGARTLLNEPFPSEIGAYPTTVAVEGSRVAIGGLEIGGIDGPIGKGVGYRSTDGGSTYERVSTRAAGRVVAGLLKVGSVYKYAEAWDQSISQPDAQLVRFRRQ